MKDIYAAISNTDKFIYNDFFTTHSSWTTLSHRLPCGKEMVHHDVRSREATHVRRCKYRSRQTITSQIAKIPNDRQILLGVPSALGVGGIGFLMSSRCSPWLLDYMFVTDRVAVASFDIGNQRLHVICIYAFTASVWLSDAIESVDF